MNRFLRVAPGLTGLAWMSLLTFGAALSREPSSPSPHSEALRSSGPSSHSPASSDVGLPSVANGQRLNRAWLTLSFGSPAFGGLLPSNDGGAYASGSSWMDGGWSDELPDDGRVVEVRPIDGVSDDWPNLFGTIIPAAIAAGQTVVLLPGLAGEHWQCKTPTRASGANFSGLRLRGTPETVIDSSLVSLAVSDSPFYFQPVAYAEGAPLTKDMVPGETEITIGATAAGGLPAGTDFFVALGVSTGGANREVTYTSQGQTGSGPYVVKLDRPIMQRGFTVANETAATVLIGRPSHIDIDGRGMLVQGTAGRFFEFIQGYEDTVQRVKFQYTGSGDIVHGSFDVGGVRCRMSELQAQNAPTAQIGFALEANEGSVIERTVLDNVGSTGISIQDGALNTIRDCEVYGCGYGVLPTSDGTDYGSTANLIEGGVFDRNGCGIALDRGVNQTIVGTITDDNVYDGILLSSTEDTSVQGTSIIGVESVGNDAANAHGGSGIHISGNTKGTTIEGANVSGSSVGLTAGDEVVAKGIVSTASNGNVALYLIATGNALVSVDDFHMTGGAGGNFGVYVGGDAHVKLANGRITMAAPGEAFDVHGGVVALENFSIDGPGAAESTGLRVYAGATVRVGANVDFDACATPMSFADGSYSSRGAVTANGTSAVVVPFPDMRRVDEIRLSGGQGTAYVSAVMVGTGFAIRSRAGDTQTYDYSVQ